MQNRILRKATVSLVRPKHSQNTCFGCVLAEDFWNFLEKIIVFYDKWMKHHDSRGGTDTPGPGESVSAIQGPQKSQENPKIRDQN